MIRNMRPLAMIALLAALPAACGDDGEDADDARVTADAPVADANTPDATPPPDALIADCVPANGTDLQLQQVASGLVQPVNLVAPPGDRRLFILERPGRIKILSDGAILQQPFIDLRPIVEFGNELGLLGMAFHPDYATNGRFYLYYTAEVEPDEPGRVADTVIAELQVSADPNVADPTSERRLLVIPQPANNHNGGHIAFGPDGYLYIGLGDGGSTRLNSQLLTTPYGAMLRIDVDGGDPYAVPPDNPFVGVPGVVDAIWLYGLRNPWRWSFDAATGDLYIADVGAATTEEISVKLAGTAGGDNFGWPVFEGDQCMDGPCDDPTPYVAPSVVYDHNDGRCAVVGGYVYRGACLPDVQGWYVYADYCSGQMWKFELADGAATNVTELTSQVGVVDRITTFGVDATGELYLAKINGSVYRLVAASN